MPDRAAIVTGASSGIGLAIAQVLAEEGHGLTLAARTPEKLESAAGALRRDGHDVQYVAGNMADEEAVKRVVAAHQERYGRLDVLVNSRRARRRSRRSPTPTPSASTSSSTSTCAPRCSSTASASTLLRAAGAEHGNALVINLSSISGKSGQPWLSVYSATKAGLIGFTQAMNKELNSDGVKSVALAPGFVDTPMTDFIKSEIKPEDMIRTADIAEAVRFLLRLSPHCVVPEIVFQRPGESL